MRHHEFRVALLNRRARELYFQNIKEKVTIKQLISFEGFRPSVLQIRDQRKLLHRIALVTIYLPFLQFSGIGKHVDAAPHPTLRSAQKIAKKI